MENNTKKSGWWRKLKLGAIVLLAIALTGELVSRFGLGLGSPPLSMEHPTIEYMFIPNQNVWRFHNRQYYNRFGMRSEDFDNKRTDPNEIRVLIIGDSVVNGGSLTDQDDLASSIVDNQLEDQLGSGNVIVGNISAGSWGPGNQLSYIREFGLFSADIIILVISSHDATDVPTFSKLNPNTHPTSSPVSAFIEGIQRYLPRYLPKWKSRPSEENGNTFLSHPNRGLSDLQMFLTEATATGARVVVIQYLNRNEAMSGDLQTGFGKILNVCNQLEIPTFSTQELFQEIIMEGQNPFRDHIHPNVLGQQLLATCILEAIRETNEDLAQHSGEQEHAPKTAAELDSSGASSPSVR